VVSDTKVSSSLSQSPCSTSALAKVFASVQQEPGESLGSDQLMHASFIANEGILRTHMPYDSELSSG